MSSAVEVGAPPRSVPGYVDFQTWSELAWDPVGRAVVERMDLQPGDWVLDACAGVGGSAIPAALRVGPNGVVDALDLSAARLDSAAQRAEGLGLRNLHCVVADVTTWEEANYDALICCYGLSFLPDRDRSVARLITLVRPDGQIGLVHRHPRAVHDLAPLLMEAAGLPAGRNPIQDGTTMDGSGFTDWLTGLGCREVSVVEHEHEPATDPDPAWLMLLQNGFRQVLPGDPAQWHPIRERFAQLLAEAPVTPSRMRSLIATGLTPSTA